MGIRRFSTGFLEMLLSDELPDPVHSCPSCGKTSFAYDHVDPNSPNHNKVEACRVCGLPSFVFWNKKAWKKCWKENGAKTVFDMPLSERCDYVDQIYDCMYRKEYVIPSDEDVKNKRIDKRIFTDNHRDLPFVKDESNLTITNDKGEKWEFPYETNRIFELDDDKRYVMLIEQNRYAMLLASDYLGVRESPILTYPGLTPDLFTFIGLFAPDCVFEDRSGVVYTATVAKYKQEYVFEDDDFHKRVLSLTDRINDIRNALPKEDYRGRNLLQFFLSDLQKMDLRGDPSRYMPDYLIQFLEKGSELLEKDRPEFKNLIRELEETLQEYRSLKRV